MIALSHAKREIVRYEFFLVNASVLCCYDYHARDSKNTKEYIRLTITKSLKQ